MLINPKFVRKGASCAFSVWPPNSPHVYETPHRWRAHGCEVERLYRDRSGAHSMAMYPLSPEHCRYHEYLQQGATILETYANSVHYKIFTRPWDRDYLCALTMMAWYLADDDASIMRFCDMSHKLDFSDISVAVWATVAFTRNMWALRERFSDLTLRRYLDNYYHLVNAINLQGVDLRTSSHPLENERSKRVDVKDIVSGLPSVSEWESERRHFPKTSDNVTIAVMEYAPALRKALPRVAASIGQARSADRSLLVQAQMLAYKKADASLRHLESYVFDNSAPSTLLAAFAVELYHRHMNGMHKLMSESENRQYRHMCDLLHRVTE